MTYNNAEYLNYSSMLSTAVGGLMRNEISADDVREMMENAIDENQDIPGAEAGWDGATTAKERKNK